ncbi:MAG: nucleotidyltransferase domain-containing protein [Solirubrobacteraceae bacterium]
MQPNIEAATEQARQTLTIGALLLLTRRLLADGRLAPEALDTLTQIRVVSPRFCAQLLQPIADGKIDGRHLTTDPASVIAYAIVHAGARAAFLDTLTPDQIDSLDLDPQTRESYRALTRLYAKFDPNAPGRPPIHFEPADLRQARAANTLIELEGVPPVITDLELYRSLATTAIERTHRRLREHVLHRDRSRSRNRGEDRALRYGVAVEPEQIIQAAGQTLTQLAREPVKIVLFGSRARGDAEPDSDYDFLVVEREVQDKQAEMVRLRRALRPLGVPCDVMVISERYAEEWAGALNSMVYSALKEGRVLHAAA